MKFFQVVVGALALGSLEPVVASPLTGQTGQKASEEPSKRSLPSNGQSRHLRYGIERRQVTEQQVPDTDVEGYAKGYFANGQPISSDGKGGPFSGGTNTIVDIQNRATWAKKARMLGGWTRQQLITDLPSSKDISAAQQHLKKGSVRELHWHKVAEWGYVYAGRLAVSAVDEDGKNSWDILGVGDVWYFPKGAAHALQGLDDDNEYLLAFDDGDNQAPGTTFNINDWLYHTPRDIVARNFGVDASVFEKLPETTPFIAAGEPSEEGFEHPFGNLSANLSSTYIRYAKDVPVIEAPGGGGTIQIFDSRSFPISKTIAASVVTIKPGGLRELHWHHTTEEWVYFVKGQGRASIFTGNARARTFDFFAGDTAVFPDNSGHYVVNTSDTEDLVWIEIFKADRIADISLTQWLALTPAPVVSQVLGVPINFVRGLKKEKQRILA